MIYVVNVDVEVDAITADEAEVDVMDYLGDNPTYFCTANEVKEFTADV